MTESLQQIAESLHIADDPQVKDMAQEILGLQVRINSANATMRSRIRQLLREQGVIAETLDRLAAPNNNVGAWEEQDLRGRRPRTALFNAEATVGRLHEAYYCENGCGWIAKSYPPAPGHSVLDDSSSRPCVVCALPVSRTPDLFYAGRMSDR